MSGSPHSESGADRGSTTGAPRWVKVSGIAVVVLVLVFVILRLAGVGGSHGPGRHTSSGSMGDSASLSAVIERGLRQPWL